MCTVCVFVDDSEGMRIKELWFEKDEECSEQMSLCPKTLKKLHIKDAIAFQHPQHINFETITGLDMEPRYFLALTERCPNRHRVSKTVK